MNPSGDIISTFLWAAGPASGIAVMTVAEIAALAAMAGAIAAWLIGAEINRFHRGLVEKRHGMHVMEATVARLHDGSPIFKAGPLARRQLKGLILGRLLRTGGAARSGLADLYRRLGFLDRDMQALSSGSWRRRAEACSAISVAGEQSACGRLAGLLGDPSEAVRVAAARALASLGGGAYAERLLDAMSSSSDWCGRMMADSVASLGGEAFEPVRGALGTARDSRARLGLIDLLGRMKDPRCIPVLMHLLRDEEVEARIRAARGLGSVRDRRAANALEEAIGDPSWEVRAQAAKSLGRVGDEICVPRLGGCLDDLNWWVRYNGAHALAALGRPGLDELGRIAASGSGFAGDIAKQVLGRGEGSEGG